MGLDMYLYGCHYKSRQHDYHIGVVETSTEIGYWRKANHIHKWFVDNVQDGKDNCAKYEVSSSDLRNLLNVCKMVSKDHSKAKELLPTQEGSFFGDVEYDEFYFGDIEETIEIINWALEQDFDYFYYQSSW